MPSQEYSWLSEIPQYGILALLAYFILTHIPEFFGSFAEMFATLGQWASMASRPMQVLGFIFLVSYWTAWIKFPTAAFWFSIVVFAPAGLTYDHYVKIQRKKAEPHS